MTEHTERIEKYAELLIREGVNLQKGQRLIIRASITAAPFVGLVAERAYGVGCKQVVVRWNDAVTTRLGFLHASDEVFDEGDEWDAGLLNQAADRGDAFLSILSENPNNLKGVEPSRIVRKKTANSALLLPYREKIMSDAVTWTVAAYPSHDWAKAVFPDDGAETAYNRLLEAILDAARVDGGDASANWRGHLGVLRTRAKKLNSLRLRELRVTSGNGTDLTVGLPEGHIWQRVGNPSRSGIAFSANIPTEEVYTAPHRERVNGIVRSTRDFVYNGNVMKNFSLTFKDGKITEVHAEQNEELLRSLVRMDEGASYLGEVALVPYHSPISLSGLIFFETLFDENAACHLAFGKAYPTCLQGGVEMSLEELKAAGLNDSQTHCDFMFGAEDTEIKGITADGREVSIFENGDFAGGL